jgi:predicted nucleic acid-binding protein
MKKVLVDSSIWISYFKNKDSYNELSELIASNQICTNDIILAELIPFLKVKKQSEIIEGLLQLDRISIEINWNMIINYQILNLKNGIIKVGIPDLIILDNTISNNLILFTEDKHFRLMQENMVFDLYEY